jgi:hypothetical protein
MAGLGRGAHRGRRQRLDPLKALRRITDHLLDHLAEIEATLAGQPTVPDGWHGRAVTLESDRAQPSGNRILVSALHVRAPTLRAVVRAGESSTRIVDRWVHADVPSDPSS